MAYIDIAIIAPTLSITIITIIITITVITIITITIARYVAAIFSRMAEIATPPWERAPRPDVRATRWRRPMARKAHGAVQRAMALGGARGARGG